MKIHQYALLSLWICGLSHNLYAQMGCTDPYATNYNVAAIVNDGSCVYPVTHNTPILRGVLSALIPESSGLMLTDGKLWTHNDSGNPNTFFSIDTTDGHTLQTVYIDNFPNVDWEDITADSNYIYLGDHGNNSGDRTDLKVLKVAKADIGNNAVVHVNAQAISFSYTDQTSFASSSTHNFDCEALMSINDSLYIFTKDRGDLHTRVYKMPKTPGTYALSPYTSFNVNGLITGADYNNLTKEIILIGYFSGHTNSFLWFLNDYQGDMFFSGNKRRIEIGNGQEWQTEGACWIDSNRFFVSCESAGNINASLFISEINWQHPVFVLSNKTAAPINISPNPTKQYLFIDNIESESNFIIFNTFGEVIKEGLLNVGKNKIDLFYNLNGLYFITINEVKKVNSKAAFQFIKN